MLESILTTLRKEDKYAISKFKNKPYLLMVIRGQNSGNSGKGELIRGDIRYLFQCRKRYIS